MSRVAIIGGGPAGLMAAEVLSAPGSGGEHVQVTVYEKMPSVARKLLMAGRGGLNLTHSEPLEAFVRRYGEAAGILRPLLDAFPPSALTAWAEGLGQPVFTGTSGRVFPVGLKASPLLRAWLARLAAQGVEIRTRHAWTGWDTAGALRFSTADGDIADRPDAVILAIGGASWPRLGSDAAWVSTLAGAGATVSPFRPANVGVQIDWSEVFRDRFEGQPLKNLALAFDGQAARGDLVVTRYGLEGGAIYPLSARVRDALANGQPARLAFDLRPDLSSADVEARLARARGADSVSNRLRKALKLTPPEIGLLRECVGAQLPAQSAALARAIKAGMLPIHGVEGLERAISSAGGVSFASLDENLMLKGRPGVFLAGEMLDWEAPTGGYLLQAGFATGVAAAQGVLRRLRQSRA